MPSSLATLACRLAAIRIEARQWQRMQQAEVVRDYEYTDSEGNVHLVTQGTAGKWINNQIIAHGAGAGKPVWEGVTHFSAHAGKSGGGAKAATKPDLAASERVRINAAIAQAKKQRLAAIKARDNAENDISLLHEHFGEEIPPHAQAVITNLQALLDAHQARIDALTAHIADLRSQLPRGKRLTDEMKAFRTEQREKIRADIRENGRAHRQVLREGAKSGHTDKERLAQLQKEYIAHTARLEALKGVSYQQWQRWMDEGVDPTRPGAKAKTPSTKAISTKVAPAKTQSGKSNPATIQTAAEADAWLHARYPNITFNFAARDTQEDLMRELQQHPDYVEEDPGIAHYSPVMQPVIAQQLMEAFIPLAQQFPQVMRQLEYVGLMDEANIPRLRALKMMGGGMVEAQDEGKALLFGGAWRNTYALRRAFEANVGYTLDGANSPEAVMRHEFGHLVQYYIEHNLTPKQRTAYDAWRQAYPYQASRVSEYATRNAEEHFAEVFAALQYGSPGIRELPEVQALGRVIDEIFPQRAVTKQSRTPKATTSAGQRTEKASGRSATATLRGMGLKPINAKVTSTTTEKVPSAGKYTKIVFGDKTELWYASEKDLQAVAQLVGHDVAPRDVLELFGARPGDRLFINAHAAGVNFHLTLGGEEDVPWYARGILGTNEEEGNRLELSITKAMVDAELQGQGIMGEIIARMAAGSRAHGIPFLGLNAAGEGHPEGGKIHQETGYYAWPRLGFDAPLSQYHEDSAFMQRLAASPFRNATRISDIMRAPGGKDWWLRFGTGGSMEFDLRSADTTAMQLITGYIREKRGANRAALPLARGAEPRPGVDLVLTPEDEAILDHIWASLSAQRATTPDFTRLALRLADVQTQVARLRREGVAG